MRRLDPDLLSAALVGVLALAAGVPVLVVQLAGGQATEGPWWLWWLVFSGFLVSLASSAVLTEDPDHRLARPVFAGQMVLGAVLVLLAPRAGWVPVLLVFTAALSIYLVPRVVTGGIIAGNTVVIGTAVGLVGSSPFEIAMAAFFYLVIQLVSVLAVVAREREGQARRDLARAHVDLRAASTLLAESSRATERLRIARDLHDVIGHQLTALTLELEVATHQSTPPAQDHVQRARRIAKDLLTDMRATVSDLREEGTDLRSALASVVTDLPEPRVHLSVAEDLRVDDRRVGALVRCVQEIVTNTIRHAGAQSLSIEVTGTPGGGTVLTASDDGRGAAEVRLGNGLRGIRERVAALGGQAHFGVVDGGSSPAGGFTVVVEVPAP